MGYRFIGFIDGSRRQFWEIIFMLPEMLSRGCHTIRSNSSYRIRLNVGSNRLFVSAIPE